MKPAALTMLLFAVTLDAQAHPHATVEQQAMLSLGQTQALLSYLVRPSTGEGAHMFDHLDSDGNGMLDDAEKAAFANELLAATTLAVNGQAVHLHVVEANMPDRETVAAGGGLLEVKVAADLHLDPAADIEVTLEVAHDRFAASWFLQPHYFPDLLGGSRAPELLRFPDSTGISVHLHAE